MDDKTQPLLELAKDYTEINTIKDSIIIEGITDANDSVVVEAINIPENESGTFLYTLQLKDNTDNTFVIKVPLEDGINLIDITAKDEWGNTSQYMASVCKLPSVEEPFPVFKVVVIIFFILMLFLYIVNSVKSNVQKYIECEKYKQQIAKGVIKDLCSIFIPLSIILVICKFVLCITVVQSGSMEPTIPTGNTVVVNRLAYLNQEVKRGDIIFFESSECSTTFGKRVIGLPGDNVEFKDGYVVINGQYVDESDYLDKNVETNCTKTFTVPDGCYFVLGDNREVSNDSRFWLEPYVKHEDIIGRYMGQIGFSFQRDVLHIL